MVREKAAELRDLYNEATVAFHGGYTVTVRVYNEGVAYRIGMSLDHDITVMAEPAILQFPPGTTTIAQYNDGFWSAYETPYRVHPVEKMPTDSVLNLPMLAQLRVGPQGPVHRSTDHILSGTLVAA